MDTKATCNNDERKMLSEEPLMTPLHEKTHFFKSCTFPRRRHLSSTTPPLSSKFGLREGGQNRGSGILNFCGGQKKRMPKCRLRGLHPLLFHLGNFKSVIWSCKSSQSRMQETASWKFSGEGATSHSTTQVSCHNNCYSPLFLNVLHLPLKFFF